MYAPYQYYNSHIYATSLYYNLHITSEPLGFYFHHTLRFSATFNHIVFYLSLSDLIRNQSQHIQSLQQLTHASQPYNMNATQSCIRNQYTTKIISLLNHKSVSHSINQHKPHHNCNIPDHQQARPCHYSDALLSSETICNNSNHPFRATLH
jgi:hypothetical protein